MSQWPKLLTDLYVVCVVFTGKLNSSAVCVGLYMKGMVECVWIYRYQNFHFVFTFRTNVLCTRLLC